MGIASAFVMGVLDVSSGSGTERGCTATTMAAAMATIERVAVTGSDGGAGWTWLQLSFT